MSERYAHVMSFALTSPWAIEREMMPEIARILARHLSGEDSSAEIAASLVNRKNLPQPRAGSVAIIPMYGVVAPRLNMMSEMSGGTTFEKLTGQLREAVANRDVKTVVFDVDSPGGNVVGATEFAREVMKARTKKPIVAVAQFKMASAAMWAMSGATEIIAAPSATLGALGVITAHSDLSEALAKLGVKKRYLYAGEGKADGNDTEPLSPEAEARMQAQIDQAYALMVGDVVKGRGKGMTADRIRKDWKAHAYSAADALALGMIDGIATLDETIARILSASPDSADQRAAIDFSSADGTAQEPIAATAQDPLSMLALQRQVLELQLTRV